jgi:hypothetical protein
VAVPNVTAIDWKQADVYGPGFEQKGGMSFTVREALVAFLRCTFCLTRFTWRPKFTASSLAHNSVGAHKVLATPAT